MLDGVTPPDAPAGRSREVLPPALVRRHLRDCPGCRAFHKQLRAKHGALGVLLPLVGVKRALLAALPGLGGGGAAATAGATGGGGLAVTALAAVAIAGAGGDAGATAASTAHDATPRAAVASEPHLRMAAAARSVRLRRRREQTTRQVRAGEDAVRPGAAALPTPVARTGPERAATPEPEPVTKRGGAERADPPAHAPAEAPAAQAVPVAPGSSAGDEERPESHGQADSHDPGGPSGHRKPAEHPAPPKADADHGPSAPPRRSRRCR